MTKIDLLTKAVSFKISLLIYFLITVGVALQIGGANWDIVWHGSRNVETFLTPPHTVIYTGVSLTIGSLIFRLIFFSISTIKGVIRKISIPNVMKFQTLLPFPLKLCIIGAILQLTAGPFDFWWHTKFGFDGLLSPPHSILATGMLMVALGGLNGIYRHYKINSFSYIVKMGLVISCGVTLMVAVGLILMFTLPFSKGQYFDFNPEPFTAIFASIILIPFVMSLFLFSISSSSKIPFIFTSITAVIIAIQATATIISNSYFVGIFPFYILNILPAIGADIIIFRYDTYKNIKANDTNYSEKKYFLASMFLSTFFITLYFPWTVDVFNGFFKPSSGIRTEEFLMQVLFPIILPIVIPISLLSSFIGGFIIQKISRKTRTNII